MAETVTKLTIHFNASGFVTGSSAKPSGNIQEVEKSLFNAVTYAVSDIAFKASQNQQRAIQNQLESKISSIVMTELRNMGRKINSLAVGIGPGNRWPQGGSLQIEGDISQLLKATDPTKVQDMSIKAVTGQWRARTEEYLKRKSKRFGHRKWFQNTGDLRQQLMNPQMYIGAYGPIRVSWIPNRIASQRAEINALRYSSLARGVGRSYKISVGELHMTILGRITRQMLNEPGQPAYDSRFSGLLDSLPESVEKKLANRGDPYRSVIEPFLTFYLNRQIPNRIWLQIEKSIRRV